MKYQTFDPNHDLRALVKCYWTLEGSEENNLEKQTIVPDGCMEMIFHYGDVYKQYTETGDTIIQPRCFVIGQLTRPLEIEPTGSIGMFSVRFHPNGFLPFTRVPIKEMENTAVSLEQLFGEDGVTIEKNILSADSTMKRIACIETFLLERLTDAKALDRIITQAVDTILAARGQLSVQELSTQNSTSRRHLERKFARVIGLSPKQLSKIIRLQTALTMLLDNQCTSLTALAYENEYYDQAHFIKEFKELTGYTPKEFYGNSLAMSTLFYGTE